MEQFKLLKFALFLAAPLALAGCIQSSCDCLTPLPAQVAVGEAHVSCGISGNGILTFTFDTDTTVTVLQGRYRILPPGNVDLKNIVAGSFYADTSEVCNGGVCRPHRLTLGVESVDSLYIRGSFTARDLDSLPGAHGTVRLRKYPRNCQLP